MATWQETSTISSFSSVLNKLLKLEYLIEQCYYFIEAQNNLDQFIKASVLLIAWCS